jgi:hypothetical protein
MLDRTRDQSERSFLIVGNGRTGSSWLLTSLDRLPGVNARQELKWRTEHSKFRADAHFALSSETSVSEAIKRVSDDPTSPASIRGSKLIFDPYWFYGPAVFETLSTSIEDDVGLILLKRDYLETWLSWKARGVYHEVDPTVAPIEPATNPMLHAMSTMARPETQSIVLHHGGQALSAESGIAYPLETAIDDMLQMFASDVQALALVKARGGLVIDYRDIAARLPEVAEFIGAGECDMHGIIAKPQTKKLPSLSHLLHPSEPLAAVSEALNAAFDGAASGSSNPELNWRWIDGGGSIMAPAVVGVLHHLGFEPHGHEIRWKVQKPIV